ncbi:MAG: carbohydrate ABC transporter permease [Anaerolineales bacterium]|jgi:multiple sugar transport system permease protein
MANAQAVSIPLVRRPRHRPTRLLGRIIVYTILILGTVITLIPFIWVILTSLKPASEIIKIPPTFFPQKWTIQSYWTIFHDPNVPLGRFFMNSLFVTGMHVILILFTSSIAGYVFAKYRFWGRNATFAFILAQMMVPFQVVMIPSYLILVKLGLVDNLWGLIVPAAVDAFGIFLMRQFIESIPSELIDAARIDGASEFLIYAQIILPQLGPALAALGIFTFMGTWNDYLWPLIVITTQTRRTLPLLLTWYNSAHGTRYDLTMAASILVMLPVLVVYLFFQRGIVRGVAMTGFK